MADDQTKDDVQQDEQLDDNNVEEIVEEAVESDAPTDMPQSEPQGAPADQSETAELKERLVRMAADFENFKRRTTEERQAFIQSARTDVVLDLLPVIDNFDRAFKDVPEEIQQSAWYGGVTAIKSQFEKVLADLGIERLPGVGSEFDPNLHEAIAHEPSDEHDENIISEEFEAGYRHGDSVIRHGRVKVSSGKN